MRRLLILFLLLSAPLSAQTLTPSPQALTTQFSSTCTVTSCATWQLTGVPTTFAAVTVSVTGTFTGTLTFKGTVDGSTYVTISATNLADGSSATTTTAAGQFAVGNSGFLALRVEATAMSAGGANVWAVRGGGTPKNLTPFLTRLYTGDGTCLLPAWSFASETDLGIYRAGADNLVVCAGGVAMLDIAPTLIKTDVPGHFRSNLTVGLGVAGGTIGLGVFAGGQIGMPSAGAIGFTSSTDGTGALDTVLARDAANVLAQRNSTAAQIFRVYNTYTNASNNEYFAVDWTNVANRAILSANKTGSGTQRSIGLLGAEVYFYTNAGALNPWLMQTTGHLVAGIDNTVDIGTSGAIRPRTGYFGTSIVVPILQGSGTGVTVANVGANSCGTSPATIAGNQVSGVITVGATAGTQCRVTFSTAAPVARDCTVTDSTTTIASRATAVSTTTHDFLGAFVAGDNVTYICVVR